MLVKNTLQTYLTVTQKPPGGIRTPRPSTSRIPAQPIRSTHSGLGCVPGWSRLAANLAALSGSYLAAHLVAAIWQCSRTGSKSGLAGLCGTACVLRPHQTLAGPPTVPTPAERARSTRPRNSPFLEENGREYRFGTTVTTTGFLTTEDANQYSLLSLQLVNVTLKKH